MNKLEKKTIDSISAQVSHAMSLNFENWMQSGWSRIARSDVRKYQWIGCTITIVCTLHIARCTFFKFRHIQHCEFGLLFSDPTRPMHKFEICSFFCVLCFTLNMQSISSNDFASSPLFCHRQNRLGFFRFFFPLKMQIKLERMMNNLIDSPFISFFSWKRNWKRRRKNGKRAVFTHFGSRSLFAK